MKYILILLLSAALFTQNQDLFAAKKITEEFIVEKLSGKVRALHYTTHQKENITTKPTEPTKPAPKISFNIEFDTNSSVINEASYDILFAIGQSLEGEAFKHLNFMIIGHTDSIGTERYNLSLSLKRAKRVKQVLISSFAIPDKKLEVMGLGQASPVASNDTEAGRAKNRRVEIVPVRQEKNE